MEAGGHGGGFLGLDVRRGCAAVQFLHVGQERIAVEIPDDGQHHVVGPVMVAVVGVDLIAGHVLDSGVGSQGRQRQGMAGIQLGLEVPFHPCGRFGQSLGNLFQDDTLLLLELLLGKGGMEKHVCLDVHAGQDLCSGHNHHEIGVIGRGVGIVVTPDPVRIVIQCPLVPAFRPVEKQMFQHVTHTAGGEGFIG